VIKETQINPVSIAHPNHSHFHRPYLEFHMWLKPPQTSVCL